MSKRRRATRPDKPHPDHIRMVEAKSERDAVYEAFGVDGNPMLRQLVKAYGVLVLASHPLTGRDVGTPRSPSYEPAIPGAATAAFRAARRRVDKQLARLLDQILAAVEEPHYRPPRGGRCPECGWRGRVGSRGCDRCVVPLEPVEEKQ